MNKDHVLPRAGGWIIIKRRLPAGLHQVPIFSMFYAVPDRLFVEGSFTEQGWDMQRKQYAPETLSLLYRHRHTKSKLLPAEIARAERINKEEKIGLEMRVKISAPDGEVCVNPYEWVPCTDIERFIEMIGDGVILHEYGDTASMRALKDKLFYMQSRGLKRTDALTMLIGEVKTGKVIWLEVEDHVASFFDRKAA